MTIQKKKLEFQSDRIEAVLALHKIQARVTGGNVTPQWVRFQVLPAVGARISRIKGLHEEFATALDVPSCRVSRRGAAVAIEVPRDDPLPVRLLPLYQQLTDDNPTAIPPITATLGLAEDGAPLLIRLPSPDVAHILVAGTTGSGKTVLLQSMILSLAMTNAPEELLFVLIDPKRHALTRFESLPHLARPIVKYTDEATEALQSLVCLMERRDDPRPHVVVVIDELADLLMMGGKPVQRALTRLTQRGREVGIHVVAATQKPTAAILGPLVKANFPVRLVGRVTSVEDARTATGWSGTGAERLTGRGDFLAVAEGRVVRFQVAHVSRDEIHEQVAKLAGNSVLGALQAIVANPPRPALPHSMKFQELPPTGPGRHSRSRTLSPVPAPAQQAQPDDETLARALIASKLWGGRLHNDRKGYRWGFMSEVSQLLFEHELEGSWHRHTTRIVTLAEKISTTTTAQGHHLHPPGKVSLS